MKAILTLRTITVEVGDTQTIMTSQKIQDLTDQIFILQHSLEKNLQFTGKGWRQKALIRSELNFLQVESTSILDLIDSYPECSGARKILKMLLEECLEHLLDMIMNYYSEYADLTINMANIHFRLRCTIIQDRMPKLHEAIDKVEIDQSLKTLALSCIDNLLAEPGASYARVTYVDNFQYNLIVFFAHLNVTPVRQQLIRFMHYNHYNTDQFIDLMKADCLKDLDLIPDLHDRLMFLVRKRDQLSKPAVTKKNPNYNPADSTIYNILIKFMQSEIDCLEIALRKLIPILVPFAAPVKIPLQRIDYRLRFNLSVDALAYLIKLMATTNVIEPDVKAEMYRFAAERFQTRGTKHNGISVESFITKYKNVTETTAGAVRAALMAMLKALEKDF